MKFYAKVSGKDFVELFVHVNGTISKLAEGCVLHVSQDKLCFVTIHSRVMHEARVWWDLPVGVLSRRAGEDFPEPRDQACDVRIYLPALNLKNIIERMVNMGNQVLIEATNDRMNFSVETNVVCIKSYFNNLGNPQCCSGYVLKQKPEEHGAVWVGNRKLLQFFEGQQINPTMALCNILSNTLFLHFQMSLFIFFILFEMQTRKDFVLQFFFEEKGM
ncbi:LOW QUALITY PROTEIN: checkpoint protein HUS1B [Glossophaga mutica]